MKKTEIIFAMMLIVLTGLAIASDISYPQNTGLAHSSTIGRGANSHWGMMFNTSNFSANPHYLTRINVSGNSAGALGCDIVYAINSSVVASSLALNHSSNLVADVNITIYNNTGYCVACGDNPAGFTDAYTAPVSYNICTGKGCYTNQCYSGDGVTYVMDGGNGDMITSLTITETTTAQFFLNLTFLENISNVSVPIVNITIFNSSDSFNVLVTNGSLYTANFTGIKNFNFTAKGYYPVNVTYDLSGQIDAIIYMQLDNVPPVIRYVYPNATNYSISLSTNFTFQINSTDDLGIFSFVKWLYYPNGTISIVNNTNISGLPQKYDYNETLLIGNLPLGIYSYNVTICDGHTATKIPQDYNVRVSNGSLSIMAKDANIDISMLGNTFSFTKSQYMADRISYVIEKKIKDPIGTANEYQVTFKLASSSPLYYFPGSKYKGHFVTAKHWIDFEGVKSIDLVACSNAFSCDIVATTQGDTLSLNSFGNINCVTAKASFTIGNYSNPYTIPSVTPSSCPSSSQGYFTYVVLLFISALLLIMGIIGKDNAIFGMLGGAGIIITGYLYGGCVADISIGVMVAGIICVIMFIVRALKK